jgi:hypothetical protein
MGASKNAWQGSKITSAYQDEFIGLQHRVRFQESVSLTIMRVSIYLGPEVATFPPCDDLGEVGAMIYAIDQVREKYKLPPYKWSPAELVELGVPQDIAESVSAQELPKLYVENIFVTWDDIRQPMI